MDASVLFRYKLLISIFSRLKSLAYAVLGIVCVSGEHCVCRGECLLGFWQFFLELVVTLSP